MSSKADDIYLESYVKTALFGFGKKRIPDSEEQIEGMYGNDHSSNTRIARDVRNRPVPALASQNLESLSKTIQDYSMIGAMTKRILMGFVGAGLGAGVGAGVTNMMDPQSPNIGRNAAIGAGVGGVLGYSREKLKQREKYEEPMTNYNILRAWAPDAALQIDRVAAKNLYRLNKLENSRPLAGRLVGI